MHKLLFFLMSYRQDLINGVLDKRLIKIFFNNELSNIISSFPSCEKIISCPTFIIDFKSAMVDAISLFTLKLEIFKTSFPSSIFPTLKNSLRILVRLFTAEMILPICFSLFDWKVYSLCGFVQSCIKFLSK